jgi:hypothetical protein
MHLSITGCSSSGKTRTACLIATDAGRSGRTVLFESRNQITANAALELCAQLATDFGLPTRRVGTAPMFTDTTGGVIHFRGGIRFGGHGFDFHVLDEIEPAPDDLARDGGRLTPSSGCRPAREHGQGSYCHGSHVGLRMTQRPARVRPQATCCPIATGLM